MPDIFDEVAAPETDIFDELTSKPAPYFQDLSAGEAPRINPSVGMVTPPERLTTYGGPRRPLASYAETAQSLQEAESPLMRLAAPRQTLTEPRVAIPSVPIKPESGAWKAGMLEAINAAKSLPEFFTSDAGVLAALSARLSPRLTSGGFSADLLTSAYQQAKQSISNWNTMTPAQHGIAVADTLATILFGGVTGAHAAGLKLPKPRPPVQGPLATGAILKPPAERAVPSPATAPIEERAALQSELNRELGQEEVPQTPPVSPKPEAKAPEEVAPVETPAQTQSKVEQIVNKTVYTEGAEAAKEVKAQWVQALEQAIAEAPSESGYTGLVEARKELSRPRPFIDKAVWDKAKEELGTVTIHIPGDGVSIILNTKEALQAVLDRAKRLSVKTKPTAKIPTGNARRTKDAALLEVPETVTPQDAEMASNHLLAFDSITDGYKPADTLPKGEWSGGEYNTEPLIKAIWASIPSREKTTVAQAREFLVSRERQLRALAGLPVQESLPKPEPTAEATKPAAPPSPKAKEPDLAKKSEGAETTIGQTKTPQNGRVTYRVPATGKSKRFIKWNGQWFKEVGGVTSGKPIDPTLSLVDALDKQLAKDIARREWQPSSPPKPDLPQPPVAPTEAPKPSPGPPAKPSPGKEALREGRAGDTLADLTAKLESGQTLTQAEKKRYLKLRNEATGTPPEPAQPGISVGPGAASPGDVPPGAQIEHLSDAFRRITADKPSLAQRVREAFALGEKKELSQNLVARTLSALKTSGDYLIHTWKGDMALDPILKVKGQLSAEIESRGWRMRRAMKDMRRAVPSKLVREAISKYVDVGGDMDTLAKSAETVPATRRAAYLRALKLTPEEKLIAGHIQSYFEARLQEAIDAGVLRDGVEDYIHRIYPKDTKWRKGVINMVQNGVLDTRTPGLARQRLFKLDSDAEAAGLQPVSDFIPRILDYEASLSKVIASRAAVKRFTEIKMPDGRPMLDVSGIGIPLEGSEGVREATLIKPSFKPGERQLDDSGKPTANYRRDYQSRDYPALKRWKWATNDEQGKPIFVQGDVLIHPDAVHRIDSLLEPSKVRKYAAARAALAVGSTFKQTMLDFSGFHQVQIAIHGLEHKVNPFRLVKDVDLQDPNVQGLLRGGMTLGGEHVAGLYREGLVGRSLSRHIPGIGELLNSYHDWLFQSFIPRVKTTMALHALERNRKRFANDLRSGRMTEDALYFQTAKEANAAFGELNYIMLERSKTAQDMARLILLAPDFLEARGRFALQAGTKLGGEQRMALLLGALTMYTLARVMNKAINDEWRFEPENMFSVIYKGKAYSLRTVQGDILHAIEEPVRFWLHRLNPTITRPLFELASGRDEFGRKRDFFQVLGDTISNAVPISMRHSREQAIWTSLLNAFGGSVRRDSDVTRMYRAATEWKKNNKVRTEPGEFIYDPDKDPYRPLRLALLDANTQVASAEYKKLIAAGQITPAQALRHFQAYARSPFAGSIANDAKFYATLTDDEKKQFRAAKQEKKRILTEFLKAKSL